MNAAEKAQEESKTPPLGNKIGFSGIFLLVFVYDAYPTVCGGVSFKVLCWDRSAL